jgi:hypothetical protein
MSEPLLPTPAAGMPNYDEDPVTWEARRQRLAEKGINGNGAGTPLGVEVRRISASSPASAAWISRWKRTGIPASGRSSGTPTAPEFSSDGGRLFPIGEMSPSSGLLPMPTAEPYGSNQSPSPGAAVRPSLDRLFQTPSAADALGGHLSRGGDRSDELLLKGEVKALISSSEASPASPPPPLADGREPPTIGGSGRRSLVSLASYDPELSSWRTSQVSLLSTEDERFPRSSERWPTSGMTRRGRAFALPTSAPVTSGTGSSYLPTPSEAMTGGYTRDEERLAAHHAIAGHQGNELKRQVDQLAQIEDELLPTPKTPTGGSEKRAGRKARGSGGEDLEASLRSLGELTNPPSEGGSE